VLIWHRLDAIAVGARIVDDVAVRRAAEMAWPVYRTAHPDVDTQASRRCLLERYLHRGRDAAERRMKRPRGNKSMHGI
jgi:hypothetical protein